MQLLILGWEYVMQLLILGGEYVMQLLILGWEYVMQLLILGGEYVMQLLIFLFRFYISSAFIVRRFLFCCQCSSQCAAVMQVIAAVFQLHSASVRKKMQYFISQTIRTY